MDEVEVTVIGAGVVGLAVAAELSKKYGGLVVLERHDAFGQETSSRNSEVMHAGIYYPEGSLKARLCVEGIELLYEYCRRNSVPHSRLGKLIVATEESELEGLNDLLLKGRQNGVEGLSIIDGRGICRIEPAVTARAAILSPNTGILDTHSLMKQLYNSASSSGAIFSFGSEVGSITGERGGYVIGLKGEDYRFYSRAVINSAGLSSDRVAELAGMDVDAAGYRLRYCKGSYFSYGKASPVKMLVYPMPRKDLAGLGVHATLDLGGRLRFGPDSEYVDHIDYMVEDSKRDGFYESAGKFIKGLDREAFVPDMAGIRPRIKGEGVQDFLIRHEAERGLEGFVNLIGIESPGLTASLSIARYVRGIVEGVLG
jgi:L-2-hydroxyglutarate oxidase LhgO